jgi:mannose-1-phosphate guanylyltransferase
VRRILRWLSGHGVDSAVLNLHHRPETIAGVVGDGSDLGIRVRYSWEQPVLGSAGGPRHALPLLTGAGSDRFLIVNGDTLCDVDLGAMIEAHAASGALVTMALVPNPRPEQYGGVTLSGSGTVTGFTRRGAPGPSFHFVGVQVAERAAFEALADGLPAESVASLYPRLIAADARSVASFVSNATFRDIGTPRDYLETCMALADIEGDRLTDSRGVTISASAEIVRTVLWDDVTVGDGVRLTGCIGADDVRIPDGAEYDGVAIVRAGPEPPGEGEHVDGDLLVRAI